MDVKPTRMPVVGDWMRRGNGTLTQIEKITTSGAIRLSGSDRLYRYQNVRIPGGRYSGVWGWFWTKKRDYNVIDYERVRWPSQEEIDAHIAIRDSAQVGG